MLQHFQRIGQGLRLAESLTHSEQKKIPVDLLLMTVSAELTEKMQGAQIVELEVSFLAMQKFLQSDTV